MLRALFPGLRRRRRRARHAGRGASRATWRHAPRAVALPDDGVPTVAVLGAIGPDKGARRLERLVALARARGACGALRADRLHGCPARALAVPTTRCSPFTAATTPRTCPNCWSTIASRSCCIRRRGRRRSASRCPRRGRRDVPCWCRRSARWRSACASSGGGWVMTDAEWRDEARMLDRIAGVARAECATALAAAAARAKRALPHASLARWPTRRSRAMRGARRGGAA